MSGDGAFAYVLKVLEANATVRSFQLAVGEHALGSLPSCPICLAHPGVSRRHATLEVLRDGGLVLTDRDSKNGTFVDGRRIERMALADYAVVLFGPVQTVLHRVEAPLAEVVIAGGEGAGSPAGAGTDSTTGSGTSTAGLSAAELLPPGLRRAVADLAGGSSAEEVASHLAGAWFRHLPVERLEIRRQAGGEEVTVAVAAAAGAPSSAPTFSAAAGGWSLLAWERTPGLLARPRPLLELAVEILSRWGEGRAGSPARPAASLDLPAAEPAAPESLNPEVQTLYRRAAKVARGEVPVLVLGESGVGKEVLARWIHARSRRAGKPFLALNCAALPRELLEAELFGIERGVATGVEARVGLFEQARGGTVFLDEIGDMPPETQAKVLRALESTAIFRVGGRAPVPVEVRFLAATNRDLEHLIEEKGFRRDLYHRLAAFVAVVPPLRARPEDLPMLAGHFLRRELARNRIASPGMTGAALAALAGYPWPGNVRELENEIAKSVLLLEPGEPLDAGHLSPHVAQGPPASGQPFSLAAAVRRAEAQAFRTALAAAQGDPGRAMQLLDLPRSTYYRKAKELGVAGQDEGEGAIR